MTTVDFAWVDVFADAPFTGNPLPVVPDAGQLTVEQMAAIAREFNQSETTFLVPPTLPQADYRLRSFTPGAVEVLGAGHNALGAWIWLAARGDLAPERSRFTQQIGDEALPVHVGRSAATRARVTMTQAPPRFLRTVTDVDDLAAALSVSATDLVGGAEVVSTGAEHLLVPMISRHSVDRAQPRADALTPILADAGAEGCYIYTTDTDGTADTSAVAAYTRFFNPTVGIAEDPATGTAAGPLAALLVRDRPETAGLPLRILQGATMGRPSILELTVDGPTVALTGSGLVVAEGTLHL